jgi:outer membrane protein TolC
LANANKGYFPQFSLSAKATYQSEVTELPIAMPGVKAMSKDQYQAVAEVNQIIWDGGAIRSQKAINTSSTEVDRQKYEVDMYAINERVNQMFFGVLLLNEQQKITEILLKELENSFNRISALIRNGVANESDLNSIKVEQLKAKQKMVELQSMVKAYTEMLSVFIGETISNETVLLKPEYRIDESENLINKRPELSLFDAQINFFESQKKSIASANKPKLGVFLQAGYGKPGLNMLKDEFTPFYIGGIRLQWNLSSLYTQSSNLSKIEINKKTVGYQKESFIFNTNLKLAQQNNEIEKFLELIKTDDEIISLRKSIKQSAEVKVENGTLSVTELIREVNAENMAVQEKALHEMQLLISIYNIKNTTNN